MLHTFTATVIQKDSMDAGYVIVPIDIKQVYGRGRLPVHATFDGEPMGGLACFLFFLPLIACPNSRYTRFHANQSLLLVITAIMLGILNAVLTDILAVVSWNMWSKPILKPMSPHSSKTATPVV